MNEKLYELAGAAKISAESSLNMKISFNTQLKTFAEKFGELIVQECVIRAEREWIRNGSDTEHNQAVSKVIESIKQHFGVEE